MLIKFLNRGRGSAKSAQTYLLQAHDHKGELRHRVDVLRGNPELVTELADSLEFEHRYTSGLIAWHVEDAPTDEEIDEVLNDFERVAFAGLAPNQYSWYAVLHEDKNGAKHVHVVSARVELSTRRSMNIAPPNWKNTFDILRDKHNLKHDWASPTDLHRRKALTLDKVMLHHTDLSSSQAKREIHEMVENAIEREIVTNRADIVSYLGDLGQITRQGKDYISVKPKGFKRAIKLKGAIYEREFSIRGATGKIKGEKEQRNTTAGRVEQREQQAINTEFERVVEKRAEYNLKRYKKHVEEPQLGNAPREAEIHPRRTTNVTAVEKEPNSSRGRERRPHGEHKEGKNKDMGCPSISGNILDDRAISGHNSSERKDKREAFDVGTARKNHSADTADTEQVRGEGLGEWNSSEEKAESMAVERRSLANSIRRKQVEEEHDTIRKRLEVSIESTRTAVQSRIDSNIEAVRGELKRNKNQLQPCVERARSIDSVADSDAGRVLASKQERANRARRSATLTITAASNELKKLSDELARTARRIRDTKLSFDRAIKLTVEKAINKASQLAKKASRSYRGNMRP